MSSLGLRSPADALKFVLKIMKSRDVSTRSLAEQLGMAGPAYLTHLLSGRCLLINSRYFLPLCDALQIEAEHRHQIELAMRARQYRKARRSPHSLHV